jgi:CheY-like chemotaxis protein
VFDPFFTTKGEHEGTGLGISISQGIVREHGGRITLETAPEQGATFTIHLPVQEAPAEPEPEEPTRAPAARLRVLVVDDEPHILHYMSATLSAWGHTVSVAEDGDQGLEAASSGDFDLVITDLRMPRLNGREFFETLRRKNPPMAARIYFSTGDTVRGDTLAFLEMLERPYLHKPFSLSELRALLAAASSRLTSPAEPRVSFGDPTDRDS